MTPVLQGTGATGRQDYRQQDSRATRHQNARAPKQQGNTLLLALSHPLK